jgi:hypothetical protein
VRQFSSFTPPLFVVGNDSVTVWHILQHCSTILGLVLLATAYIRYVHGRRFLKHSGLLGASSRGWIWVLLVTLPAVRAASENAHLLGRGANLLRLDDFIFNATVSYVYTFLPLVCAAGILVSIFEYLFVTRRRADLPAPAAEGERLLAASLSKPAFFSVKALPGKSGHLSEQS